MLALLAAALLLAGEPKPEPPAPLGPLGALGPVPAGESALTIQAGTPFYAVHLDHGLGSRVDAGLGLDLSPAGFMRPQLRARVRLLSLGPTQLVARVVAAVVVPDARAGYGPRQLVRTEDGEAGLSCAWAVVPQLALFAELSALGETDFTAEHTATQVQGLLGFSVAPLGPFALVAQGGVLRGLRGQAKVGSGGVVFRF